MLFVILLALIGIFWCMLGYMSSEDAKKMSIKENTENKRAEIGTILSIALGTGLFFFILITIAGMCV